MNPPDEDTDYGPLMRGHDEREADLMRDDEEEDDK